MTYPVKEKDPQATLDYRWKFREPDDAWLEPSDSIDQATVTSSAPAELEVDTFTVVEGENVVVWLSGGTAGEDYFVTVHIETLEGRTDDRTVKILCREQ